MRALRPFSAQTGSRLAEYGARVSEALLRRRAELEARAARMEAELAIKARSEFLANMNHELRTPLNAIIGFATMLRDGEEFQLSEEQRGAYAEYILQSADLLLGHINTLLEVASLESGQVEMQSAAIDFDSLIAEAAVRAETRAAAAGVTLQTQAAGVSGVGDPERFAQALDHLLQIAVKLSHQGGAVDVRASQQRGKWAEIAVQDRGEGLDAQELDAALEAFTEIHRGLDRSFLGPGVGYAIAKTVVEMMGGRFSIESSEGKGTTARLALPLCDADSEAPQHRPEKDERAVERKHDAA